MQSYDPPHIEGYDSYDEMTEYAQSSNKRKQSIFWADIATKLLDWNSTSFTNIVGEIGNNHSFWFDGGTLNVCYNAVDRWASIDPTRKALIYEGNDPDDSLIITYGDLLNRVSRLANVLLSLGIQKGSVVSIYLPVCTEAIISMLACARIGAIHSLTFGAFRGDALKIRLEDCKPSVIITADGYKRSLKSIQMKAALDEIIGDCPWVKHVLIVDILHDQFITKSPYWNPNRDHLLTPLMLAASPNCPCIPVESSHPLFYLYTSGSTGNPKGIIHRSGGYAVAAALTQRFVFSIREGDIFGCTSDLGWITGHTYICYGPLLNGITTLVFGGLPLYPNCSRPWELISKLRLTHFYLSPSAGRAIAAGLSHDPKLNALVDTMDTSSLRIIGSVGEALDESTWHFFHEKLGRSKCCIVDTYWQTEMGSIIATSIPGVHIPSPGIVGKPILGTQLVLLDFDTKQVIGSTNWKNHPTKEAILCIASPWPGLANDTISKQVNFSSNYIIDGTNYFSTGDLAQIDENGNIKITGRNDDQLCVNGHRIGPAEVEAVMMEHPSVSEAAVVGIPNSMSGQEIVAFVVASNVTNLDEFVHDVKNLVASRFSAIGRPSKVYIVNELPKTRSEKIIRKLLRNIITGSEISNLPTLKNPKCIDSIRQCFNPKNI